MSKSFGVAGLAMTAVLGFYGPASGADFPAPAVPVAPAAVPFDWSGSYFGIKGGGAVDGRASGQGYLIGNPSLSSNGSANLDGFIVGAMAGINFQFDNLIIGIDSDYSFTGIDGTDTVSGTFNNINYELEAKVEVDFLSTTRLRLGYAMDRFMIYGTGGLATGVVETKGNVKVNGSSVGRGSDSEWYLGYAAGGGVEWAFADGWFARAEYLYVDLGKETVRDSGVKVTTAVDELHLVRGGVSMNIDWLTKPITDAVFGR